MKPYNEYLAMTAEQIMADPEAPDCYRDVPPYEMQRRIERLQKTAWELYLKNERRKGNENL